MNRSGLGTGPGWEYGVLMIPLGLIYGSGSVERGVGACMRGVALKCIIDWRTSGVGEGSGVGAGR